MEGNTNSVGSDTDQSDILEFSCKLCPGKTFSGDELNAHRAFHKAEKMKLRASNNLPGEPIAGTSTSANRRVTRSGAANAGKTRRETGKRQSKKIYDTTIVPTKSKGA